MNGEVEGVIAPNFETAQGIVDRKRKLDHRASAMRHHVRRWPEVSDLRVVHDAREVVENERPEKLLA
jgi:hypothetical protein